MSQYDPSVIRAFADDLYRKASSVVATWVVLGLIVGGAGGFFAAAAMASGVRPEGGSIVAAAGILAIIGALIGYYIGSARAFTYRLQAQTALCQVQIEANTRSALTPSVRPAEPREH